MEFFKVNDHSFHCTLSSDDLKKYGLSINDFLTNSSKVQELLQELMEMAHDEIGFTPGSDAVALKMMPLPDGKLDIVFLGEAEEGQFNNMLLEALKSACAGRKESTDNTVKPENRRKANKCPDCAVFTFDSLDSIALYCRRIYDGKPVNSDIYKDEAKDVYYMVIRKGRLSRDYFCRICAVGTEYGDMAGQDLARGAYVTESFTPIIRKRAVKIMSIL